MTHVSSASGPDWTLSFLHHPLAPLPFSTQQLAFRLSHRPLFSLSAPYFTAWVVIHAK